MRTAPSSRRPDDQSVVHLCFFSGKRGGFNHFVPILEAIEGDDRFDYTLLVADMHLSSRFGDTVNEVLDHARTVRRVETLMDQGSKVSRAKSLGVGILGMADMLLEMQPDYLVVLGDRLEIMGPVLCAAQLNIPVVHLFGGDLTQGGVDELVRHAVTKLANVHFPATQDSARRILAMGEEQWRVHVSGSPALDLIRQGRFTPADEVRRKYGLDADGAGDQPAVILLQHSVTWQVESARDQIRETLEAIDALGLPTIAVHPCSDPGYEEIVAELEAFDRPFFRTYPNIPFMDFWGLMHIGGVLLGNSSAGVLESTSFGLPAVDIGTRQQDRLRAENVIHAEHDAASIEKAARFALDDEDFRQSARNCVSPYGDGHASQRILDVLHGLRDDQRLITKKMTY
jgi:UDP-N-acetylglucosamine 2-epimerase (non-hydrolysing)/GDP/UDP-N,N'-diacetylbacillosamine 2-epimerase (hydrolysing)